MGFFCWKKQYANREVDRNILQTQIWPNKQKVTGQDFIILAIGWVFYLISILLGMCFTTQRLHMKYQKQEFKWSSKDLEGIILKEDKKKNLKKNKTDKV